MNSNRLDIHKKGFIFDIRFSAEDIAFLDASSSQKFDHFLYCSFQQFCERGECYRTDVVYNIVLSKVWSNVFINEMKIIVEIDDDRHLKDREYVILKHVYYFHRCMLPISFCSDES